MAMQQELCKIHKINQHYFGKTYTLNQFTTGILTCVHTFFAIHFLHLTIDFTSTHFPLLKSERSRVDTVWRHSWCERCQLTCFHFITYASNGISLYHNAFFEARSTKRLLCPRSTRFEIFSRLIDEIGFSSRMNGEICVFFAQDQQNPHMIRIWSTKFAIFQHMMTDKIRDLKFSILWNSIRYFSLPYRRNLRFFLPWSAKFAISSHMINETRDWLKKFAI